MALAEKLKIAGVLALLLAGLWFLPLYSSPQCTTDIVTGTTALNKSYEEVSAAKNLGKQALCKAYRHHVEVLEALVPVAKVCGPGQMTRRSLWPHPETELEGYRSLVAEQCSA